MNDFTNSLRNVIGSNQRMVKRMSDEGRGREEVEDLNLHPKLDSIS